MVSLSVKVEKAKRKCQCLGAKQVFVGMNKHKLPDHYIEKGESRLTITGYQTEGYLCMGCLKSMIAQMENLG